MMKCTLGPKHRYEWVSDRTLTNVKMTVRGTVTNMRRVGVFKCACGAVRHGIAKTGL